VSTFDPSGLTVYVNGEFVDGAKASISVFDHGLLYADGIFEGLRLFSRALFRPRDHLARLARSAQALLLDIPLSADELLETTIEVIRRSNLDNAHVRIVVTRGFGTPGIDPWRCELSTVIVAAYPFPPLLGENPVALLTSAVVRKAPRSIGAHVKSLNYIDAITAKQQARAAGMNDAVMLDAQGAVAECTSANVFAVHGETLLTPTTRAALPGITRRTILELAREQGVETVERDIYPAELHIADALFLTGSGAGIVPVGSIDGHQIPTADHPIYNALRDGYRARTADPRFIVPVDATERELPGDH
jgi:branched-chain amino acid aminotransferase